MTNVIKIFGTNGQVINETPKSAMEAEFAHSQVSNKYNQVKTLDIVRALEEHGWAVNKYREATVKNPDRRGFQKHMVWMQPNKSENAIKVGDAEFRLILSNSHDGTSAFKLQAGLFRLVCSNGLVVSVGDLEHISIRHTVEEIEQVAIDGALKVAAMAPKINEVISKMRETELTQASQVSFAKDASAIVWGENQERIHPASLLQIRRTSDKGDNLWSVFNVVQENLVRGGISTIRSNRRTRGINSPVKDLEINKKLFELAVKYAA